MSEPDPMRWKALAVVCAAFFMTVLDVSIVNVALPSIGRSLHFSRDSLQWVVTAYAITFGGLLLLGGRAADLLGRRRVFLVGVVVFTVASFFCGLAWSSGILIASRAVQGIGAAIISPAALSIVTTTFDEGAERNKALGIWGAIGGSGAAVGVLAGGILTKYLGWEWIFFVNVPVGVGAFLLAPRFVRESTLRPRQLAGRGRCGDRDGRPGAARLRRLEGARPRLGLRLDPDAAGGRGAAAAALLRDRDTCEGSADAVQDLPRQHGRGRERRRAPAGRRRLRELLHPHALRPERARLVGAEDGADVRGDRRHGGAVGGARPGARHPDRRRRR